MMPVSRIDLADVGSPEKLVAELLKAEPNLPIPVPVHELALQLDIQAIQPLTTEGFEGGLITDSLKSSGIILVNQSSPPKRRRFTLAHELGHFLIPTHVPLNGGQFLCRAEEMLSLERNEQDRRLRMEAEANRFASLLLLPPPMFRVDVARSKDPDLQDIVRLSNRYEVSREATGRAYIQFSDEPAALLVTHEGRLLRSYRNIKFPSLSIQREAPLPAQAMLNRKRLDVGFASDIDKCDAAVWIEVSRSRRVPTMFEQVLPQQRGYAMVLLHIEAEPVNEEKEDPEERMTSKERLQHRRGW